jgi:hypothetical protein
MLPTPTRFDLVEVARSLLLDHAAIEILSALSTANIPALLLKGASFQTFYPDQPRVYFDIDIMLPQSEWAIATRELERLEFVRHRVSPTGEDWRHARDEIWVDLHFTLSQLRLRPAEVWTVLWREHELMPLHAAMVPVLNERARLFHVALHAIQSGNTKPKPIHDLARAVAYAPLDQWRGAWALAGELGAAPLVAAVLRLYAPGGGALADQLGAPRRAPFLQLVHALEGAPNAAGLLRLTEGNLPWWAVVRDWIWPYEAWLKEVEGGIPTILPAWIGRRRSRFVKFYVWRCCQVADLLCSLIGAVRLSRAADPYRTRQSLSRR